MKKGKAPLKSTQIQRAATPAPAVASRPATPRPMPLSRAAAPLQRVGCACGGEIGADGQCADCRARRERVQRKMTVNPPGDALEQEADQVARAHVQRQAAEEMSGAAVAPVQRRAADEETAAPIQRATDDEKKNGAMAAMPVQRQMADDMSAAPDMRVQRQAADEKKNSAMPAMPAQRQADDENMGASVQRQATEPEKPVQRKAADEDMAAPIQRQTADEKKNGAMPSMPVQRQMADDMSAAPDTRAQRQPDNEDMATPVQRQATEPEEPVQRKAADEDMDAPIQRQTADEEMVAPAQRQTADENMAAPVQRQAAEPEEPIQRQTADENMAAPVQRQATEPEEPVQRQMADEDMAAPIQHAGNAPVPEVTPSVESGIQNARGGGSALPPAVQRSMEDTMGADLSGVRVHHDGQADQLSRQLDARAFTSGQDIFFRGGEYNPESGRGRELLAHEAAHTVQQGGGGEMASRAPASSQKKSKGKEMATAPGEVDLLGKTAFTPSPEMAAVLEEHKKALVKVKFGKMAEGLVPVKYVAPTKKQPARYVIDEQALPLAHPLFSALGEAPDKLRPVLIIDQDERKQMLTGYIGIGGRSKLQSALKGEQGAQLLGLTGMRVDKLPTLENKLENGHLILSITNLKVKVGAAFDGLVNVKVDDDKVALDGSAQIVVPKLAKGELTLNRSAEGAVTGEGTVAAELPPQYSGSVKVTWDGQAINGEGKIGYKGEKLSGEVTLRLMEEERAKQLKKEKQAPPPAEGQAPAEGKAPAAAAPARKGPAKPKNYVVFGEGDMQFAFTEWLNGTAHVIVDHEGYLTIIGEVTPQKEYELFPQKDYIKPLFKLEARAGYGVPVIGTIGIFANVGMDAFAKLGPVKLYNITAKGNYSTDPREATEFEIKGSLNVSAAAGLRLRAEAGAVLEVLDHDLKAGVGVTGIAGIRAYAEATPIIGRRARGNPEEDKKEEYFIRGELEIAGQPFLGLSGDLFVELDSPWWSPAPDKTWRWPLGDKEWPIGGTFGLLASVDYVFGSGEYPTIDFKPVDSFSPENFTTGLFEDKAQPKSGEGEPKKTDWKEKNSPEDAPPVGGGKGEVAPGKAGEPAAAKAKAPAGGGGKANAPKHADPDARTAEGKSVKELKAKAARENKKPEAADGQGKPAGAEETPSAKSKKKKGGAADLTPDERWERGGNSVRQVLARAEKEGSGITDLDDLNRILRSIRKQYGFTTLFAKPAEDGEYWVVSGTMNPSGPVTKVKRRTLPPTKVDHSPPDNGRASHVVAEPLTKKAGNTKGSKPQANVPGWAHAQKLNKKKDEWVRLHLLSERLHGPGQGWNLTPGAKTVNSAMEKGVEREAKEGINASKILFYETMVEYHESDSGFTEKSNFPKSITVVWGEMTVDGKGRNTSTAKTWPSGAIAPPPKDTGGVTVNINKDGRDSLKDFLKISEYLARSITEERKSKLFSIADFEERMEKRNPATFRAEWRAMTEAMLDPNINIVGFTDQPE